MKCDEGNAEKTIADLISLKHTLQLVQDTALILDQAADDAILSSIRQVCGSKIVTNMMSVIHEVMQEDVMVGKGTNAKTQQVFAVKQGIHQSIQPNTVFIPFDITFMA